ncbi:MAG: GNAT family N-acetyltransferase [Candidatus Coproplasma sp.]
MQNFTVKHDQLTANEFIELWKTAWEGSPSLEQTELAMKNCIFRVSVYDGERVVAMARLIGDFGLCCYIKDVVVRPEYQGKGLGKLLIDEIKNFVKSQGVKGTSVFIELCARPGKEEFYKKLGFENNDGQSMIISVKAE